jgi:hypothetical protein
MGQVELKMLGIGLPAAVLLDATIVRGILAPAAMTLLGDRCWYLPRWLSWLPGRNALLGDGGEVPQVAELDLGRPATQLGAGKAHEALPRRSGLSCSQRVGGHAAPLLLPVMDLTCGDACGLSAARRHLLE